MNFLIWVYCRYTVHVNLAISWLSFWHSIWLRLLWGISGTLLPSASEPAYSKSGRNKNNRAETSTVSAAESRKNKRNRKEKERVSDVENVPVVTVPPPMSLTSTTTTNHLPGQSDNVSSRKKKGDNSASSAFGSGTVDTIEMMWARGDKWDVTLLMFLYDVSFLTCCRNRGSGWLWNTAREFKDQW